MSSTLPPLRLAAGVIPVRPGQVYLVQRSSRGSFFPGFHAFPGGAWEPQDEGLKECALRELFEEVGLWLGQSSPSAEERRALLGRELSLKELLGRYPVDWSRLLPAGTRITPDYSHIRFEAHFFILTVEPGEDAEVWPGELEGGRWWGVQEAWQAFTEGQIFLAAPTQTALQRLLHSSSPIEAAAALGQDDPHTGDYIPVAPGLGYVPLLTLTLPPARHTHCFLLEREGRAWLVDPGSGEPEQCQRLETVLEQRGELGVQAVLFTHHHPDHVGGYDWARSRGWPIFCHPQTGLLLEWSDFTGIDEGQEFGPGWRVLSTPGHASGHLCLWEERRKILLAGDLVSSLSTILVHPPDGAMADYLKSLARCQQLEPQLVLPCHGPPFGPGSDLLGRTLAHRLEREKHVLQALTLQPQNLKALVENSYADTPANLHGIARWSLLAHLLKLEAEGRVEPVEGGQWCLPRTGL